MNIEQERLEAIINSFLDFVIKEHGAEATLYILTTLGLTEEEILDLCKMEVF